MKKNIILYVLLAFLIIVNGIFLFLFLNKPGIKGQKPEDFIAKQLKFDERQLEQFGKLNDSHKEDRRKYADDTKQLKDMLFSKISDENVTSVTIDSITNLIGRKEQAKEMMVFNHFRELRAICNEKQKGRLDKIIEDGLDKGQEGMKPPGMDREGQGPPPPPR